MLVSNKFVNFYFSRNIVSYIKKSERIRETSYFIPWYNFPTEVAQNIKTIILRASRPSSLSGAKILDLSLQAFCDVNLNIYIIIFFIYCCKNEKIIVGLQNFGSLL